LEPLITTIAPAGEASQNSYSGPSGPTGEIGKQLRTILGFGRVLDRAIDRIAYSSDASFYSLVPQAITQPATLEEIGALFQFSRTQKVPLVFRAGGTSLSGQAITNGVLVDISRYWRKSEVQDGGRAIRVQPGVIGQGANDSLKAYGAKIGPDPASIGVARLGGILSNNASGMCCGVIHNAYHTLRSMKFMLPSGTIIDTGQSDSEVRFRQLEPQLCSGLLELKARIEQNPGLAERIRSKYRMKNTTGYSLNAFLDFDTPAQILSHLLIGAEGTLGFIAEAVLETIPDLPLKYTGLLVFPSLHSACGTIVTLREAGAATIELMDRASLRSVEMKPGMPADLASLPESAAALLVEFHAATHESDQLNRLAATKVVESLDLVVPPRLTGDSAEQAQLWNIRKGLFPSVGAVRARGTSVIIEDVAFPVEKLADAATDLTTLFKRHNYSEAILFGHAKDGNLHFVITQGFDTEARVAQYRAFIEDVVSLVVHRYDGALKAEHGTGRNMAPFVESEWGPEAFAIMRELKTLIDPENLLNPGVILNPHSDAHIRDLKLMPEVEPEIDKCIECGYCEPKCPSRDLTLTPRQRIVVRRTMERLSKRADGLEMRAALDRDFPYMVLDTCAVDGLCATSCPVDIDTGTLTKRFRAARHSSMAQRVALAIAHSFSAVEDGARLALGAGHLVQTLVGSGAIISLTRALDFLSRRIAGEPFWKWSAEMPHPRKGRVPSQVELNPDAVYFPTCISRIMGALPGEADDASVMDTLLSIAHSAGVRLTVPNDVQGHCCGVPFSSKGFDRAHDATTNKTIESFFRWSNGGAVPIVLDTSPCTYGLKTCRSHLTPENQERFDRLRILDSIEFVSEFILPKLTVRRRVHRVAVHPVCSVVKMGLTDKLTQVMKACSEEVVVPRDAGCCAFAGDRGFLFPELTASATETEASQIRQQPCDAYFSSSKTCEIGMTRATGHVYRSYLHLLDYGSRMDES
jgi:D-lactate dehydrogenase